MRRQSPDTGEASAFPATPHFRHFRAVAAMV
jgi:hypothetical protein